MVIVEVLNESAQVLIHSAVKSFQRIETFLLFRFNFLIYAQGYGYGVTLTIRTRYRIIIGVLLCPFLQICIYFDLEKSLTNVNQFSLLE